MIAFDTNVLFPALEPSHADHEPARHWLESLAGEVALSELVLMELYVLVRNPVLAARPLDPPQAVALIETLRTNPRWRLLDAPEGSMAEVWKRAADPGFGRRRVFDARIGVSLVRQGVKELATRNVRDFEGLGFARVFDPLIEIYTDERVREFDDAEAEVAAFLDERRKREKQEMKPKKSRGR